MIRLENVSFAYIKGRPVFPPITLDLPSHRRMALIGPAESGKTTLINLLAGTDEPDTGRVKRFARVSIPGGYQRGFRFAQTARQNAIFAARCYDADPDEVMHFVGMLSRLGDSLERPMRDLPVSARLIFSYVLAYALPFDTYLFDNIIGPAVPGMRELWEQLYAARTRESGAIIATRQPKLAEQLCDCLLLMGPEGAIFYDDIKDGLGAFQEARAAAQGASVAEPATAAPAKVTS